MAATGVFGLARFTGLAAGDVLPAVDISDSTQNAHGSLDAITVTNFFASIPVPVVVTSASANALAVGLAGSSNSAFLVDCSTALQVAGLKVTGAVTGGTVAVVVTDSGLNASLTVNAKGSGTIGIGSVSTGRVTITPATTITGALTQTGLATFNGGATIASGQTLTVSGATITGLTAASVGAGTFPSGSFVFAGAVSGITTLAGTGAVSGFTTAVFSSTVTALSMTVKNGASDGFSLSQVGALSWQFNALAGSTALAFANFNTIAFGSAALSGINGLTVSAGTTAVQALTATTITTSGSVDITGTGNSLTIRKANNLPSQLFVGSAGNNFSLGYTAADTWALTKNDGTTAIISATQAGAVSFVAGISCTTGTFSGGVVSSTGTQAVSNGATTTFATITVEGCYLVSVHNGANFATIGWYLTGSTFTAILTQTNSTTTSFQVSGNNVQITNTTGGSVTYTWSILRIS